MKGFPKDFKTRNDLIIGIDYCKSHPSSKPKMRQALNAIKENTKVLTLKENSLEKPIEELNEADFYLAEDMNCTMHRMGITENDIDAMLKEVM